MRVIVGDLWSFHGKGWLVVPTNLGWSSDGNAVMGAGVAKEAAKRYPDLKRWYGKELRAFAEETPPIFYTGEVGTGPFKPGIVLFPTKPLNTSNPALSWKSDSSLQLIERGLDTLGRVFVSHPIYFPLIGCGLGNLAMQDVLPLMAKYLPTDDATLVLPEGL